MSFFQKPKKICLFDRASAHLSGLFSEPRARDLKHQPVMDWLVGEVGRRSGSRAGIYRAMCA